MNLRALALIPFLTLIISIFVVLFLDLSDKLAFNPPYLLLALNLIFWTAATLAIAFVSAKSFLKEDSSIVLIISCSIIIFGLPVIISGWVQTFSVNKSIALSNPCILVASILQLIGSILAFQGKQETKTSNRKRLLATVYLASVILVLANLTIALLGYYPPFFLASGPTLLRQTILGSSVFFFAVAAIVFGAQYLKAKSPSLYWYALAIELFSVGLFSAFEQKSIGDVPTWLGRIALYIGTVYLTAAILSSNRKVSGTDRASAWAGAFKANPEQFEALFSNIFDAFIYGKTTVNKQGKPIDWVFLDVNDSYSRVAGLTKEQVIGKTATELYPEEHNDPTDWIGKYGRVALTGEPLHFEGYRLSFKKWLHVSSYSPKKGYFIAIFEDITERKKAEDAIKQSEERYHQLFSSMTEMFQVIELIYDENGKAFDYYYRNVNPAFEKLVGKTREQLVGKRAKDLFGMVENYWIEVYDKVAKTGKSMHYENYGSELDKWYDIYAWETNDKQVAIIFTDVTERKKAEEALKDSEAKFKTLAENAPDAIMRFDRNLRVLYLNPQDLAETGKTLEEFIGKTNEEMGMPKELCKLWNNMFDKVKTSGKVQEVEFDFTTPAGVKTFNLRIAPEFSGDGSLVSYLGISRDITERKKAEVELDLYRKNLEKLVEQKTKELNGAARLAAIGATAGMVGHDIRNPLQAITSDVFLVRSELDGFPNNECKQNAIDSLNEIEVNIDYINKIVADLQDYARPLNPRAQESYIKTIVEETIARQRLPKEIKIVVNIDEQAQKVMGDPDYLKRIISNLVLNAVQAMPNGGTLTVKSTRDGQSGEFVLTVEDTGVGIADDVKDKLFTPMFTTKSKGQGFGLAVVKRMTETLGGTVTFESEHGKGTKFIVHFPPPKS